MAERSSPDIVELLERADEYLGTISNKGNCGPHHLVSDLAAALRSTDAAATPSKPVLDRDVIAALVLNMWTHGSSHLQIADEILRRLTNAAQPATVSLEQAAVETELFFMLTSFMDDGK